MNTNKKRLHGYALAGAMWLSLGMVSGCAHGPVTTVTGYSATIGEQAADTAISMIGMPYKYQGENPSGFDCSGLVRYSYLAAGIDLPHGTRLLKQRTVPVLLTDMRKGDILFFEQSGKQYSHVGIYLDNNRFVHAPSRGKRVREESLDDPYWKKHFLGVRRVS